MKPSISLILLSPALCACTAGTPGMSIGLGIGTGIGHHVGLGTSVNIPITLDKNKTTPNNTGGINIIEEQIRRPLLRRRQTRRQPSQRRLLPPAEKQTRRSIYRTRFLQRQQPEADRPLYLKPQPTDAIPRYSKRWFTHHIRL